MFGSAILEVAIGMIFIYLLLAIMCSAIREGIEAWSKTRAAYLEYGVRELLHDKMGTGLAKGFFHHPLIFNLFSGEYRAPTREKRPGAFARGGNMPSYIPPRSFALALLDIAARGPSTNVDSSGPRSAAISLDSVRANIQKVGNEPVQRAMLAALDSAQGDLDKAVAALEAWYDGTMERVSGWYKRSTHRILFVIGLVVAIAFNVNSIVLADHLYRDDASRAALVARAEAAAAGTTTPNATTYAEARAALDSLGLPIGWGHGLGTTSHAPVTTGAKLWYRFLSPALGWLLTALAAVLGAPFWFDLLDKIMVVRSTVKPGQGRGGQGTVGAGGSAAGSAGGSGGGVTLVPVGSVALQSPVVALQPSPSDPESGVDGCDVEVTHATPDEELPPSRGGVE